MKIFPLPLYSAAIPWPYLLNFGTDSMCRQFISSSTHGGRRSVSLNCNFTSTTANGKSSVAIGASPVYRHDLDAPKSSFDICRWVSIDTRTFWSSPCWNAARTYDVLRAGFMWNAWIFAKMSDDSSW